MRMCERVRERERKSLCRFVCVLYVQVSFACLRVYRYKLNTLQSLQEYVGSPYLIIHGRVTCIGTIGRAISAIFSEGSPASISLRPVTLSAAANATYKEIQILIVTNFPEQFLSTFDVRIPRASI